MTFKLLKYDLRSTFRSMWMFWVAAPVMAVVTALIAWGYRSIPFIKEYIRFIGVAAKGVTGTVFTIVMVIMMALTVVVIIQRFYKGLFAEEGYLSNTLPAKPWQLITSKGIAALVTVIISSITAILAIIIIGGWSSVTEMWQFVVEVLKSFTVDWRYVVIALEIAVIGIFSIMKTIYQLYASMSIGQLADKHRVLISVIAFIGLGMIMGGLVFGGIAGFSNLVNGMMIRDWYNTAGEFGTIEILALAVFLLTILQVAIFHIITERIISKKLNLL